MTGRLAIYRRLIGYLRPHSQKVFLAYGGMFAGTLLSLFIPQIIENAIDKGMSAGIPSALYQAAAIILLIAIVRGATAYIELFYGEWLTHRVAYDLRNQYYNRVQHLPFAFHDHAHTGDLMSRATSDISETERFIGVGLMGIISTLVMLIGVTIAMILEDWQLALLGLSPMPILIFATIRFGKRVNRLSRRLQDQMGTISKTMQESLTGIRVVKAFAREPHELEKFDRDNTKWLDIRYLLIREWGSNWPFFTFLVATSIFLLLWFGGPRALNGNDISVGSLFAMISYVLMLNAPVQRLGFLTNLAASAAASSSRVFEIMDTPNEIGDRPGALEIPAIRGELLFENVSFGYRPNQLILHNISFTAPAGKVIALIGPTGSGKSTITNLIPRFYEPTMGNILVDGYDIRQITAHSLRRQIGTVLQDPFLFSQSIAENIAYGHPHASMEEIIAAAQTARAHEFITNLPKGYNTRVGERGVTLSGGQKQRIAIARALLADPRILILDDSTSSVDTETEHLIQQALRVLQQGRTTFIIAQRLLTLKNADMILVLEKGQIVERGTHVELLAKEGLYREIYDLQLKDQEEFVTLQEKMMLNNEQTTVEKVLG